MAIGRWVVLFALARTLRVHEYGGWVAAVPWLATCAVAWRWRAGHGALALFAFVSTATFVPHNGMTSIGWMAAAIALFRGEDLRLALRVKVTCVYGFAAVHKLLGPFASGAVLAAQAPWMPAPWLMAPVVIYLEALLAAATWRRWPAAFPLAVVLHAGILFGASGDLVRLLELLGWQVSMPVLVYYVTRPVALDR